MKKVKTLLKRVGHIYTKSFYQMYGPCIEAGICPFV